MAKFQSFRDKAGKYRFRLKGNNGETILASEGYSSRQACLSGIESVRHNSVMDERYNRLIATNGGYYFNLIAANGEIIGTSEVYSTKTARDNGIYAVKSNAPAAELENR